MELIIFGLATALFFMWRKNAKDEEKYSCDINKHQEQNKIQSRQIAALTSERDEVKSQVSKLEKDIIQLKKQLEETTRALEFYKNIEEESGKLNVDDHSEDRQDLIEQAAHQIKETRSLQQETSSPLRHNAQGIKALLDAEQLAACEEMEHSSHNFFITGKAGTGKSFLLDVFRRTTKKKHLVLAPTGIAALNVNGSTLHRTFGYQNLVNLDIDRISLDTIRLKSENILVLRQVSTIIIDEISMVRVDILEKIDRILKAICNNYLPFGGKQVLLFGDLFQLPPVTKGKEYDFLYDRYGGVYFFCSNAYKQGNFKFMELTINHRQKDDAGYFAVLNRIRDGSTTADDIGILNSRVVRDTSIYDRFTTLLPTKAEVESLNRYHINQLDSVGFTYPAKIILNKYPNSNPKLEAILPITDSLYLKKGALVMMVANDPGHRWVNGTLGIVSNLSKDGISVAINRQVYNIEPVDFREQEATYINGKITYEDILVVKQYPLVLAYAITIHKSQGQTYQNIVCDIDRCFTNGQAYVALSRCASLNGLHLKRRVTGSSIRVDRQVLDFYREQQNPDKLPFQ